MNDTLKALEAKISILEDECRSLRAEVYRLRNQETGNQLPYGLSWDDAPDWAHALVQGDDPEILIWVNRFEEEQEAAGVWVWSHKAQSVSTVGHHSWTLVATRPPQAVQLTEKEGTFYLRNPGNAAGKFVEWAHLSKSVNSLATICHRLSLKSGWWNHQPTGLDLKQIINSPEDEIQKLLASAIVAQKICLSHSELSEAMEGHRKGLMDDKLPHRLMIEVELADAVIRIADLAGALNLDLGGAISEKLAFNQTRPDHKPENRAKEGGKSY